MQDSLWIFYQKKKMKVRRMKGIKEARKSARITMKIITIVVIIRISIVQGFLWSRCEKK